VIESISVSLVGEIVELLVGIVDFESIVGKTFGEKNTKTIEHILKNFMMHTKTPNYQRKGVFLFHNKTSFINLDLSANNCGFLSILQCFEEFLIKNNMSVFRRLTIFFLFILSGETYTDDLFKQ
jgi:hypothetical protein